MRLECWSLLTLIPLFSAKSIPEAPRACNAEIVPCFRVGCGGTCNDCLGGTLLFSEACGLEMLRSPFGGWRVQR